MRIAHVVVIAGILLVASVARAQTGRGGIPIRIPGAPAARCINGKTDRVWLTLYRVIMSKKGGWFTSSKQVEIITTVTVKSLPAGNQTLSFPLSAKINIGDFPVGQVSIPVEYTLVSGLALKQKTPDNKEVSYTGIELDTTLIHVRSASALGATLSALAEITGSKKLPIPSSPYTEAAGYLLEFANSAVSNAIKEQNADEKVTAASLALNFDPTGQCTGASANGTGFETTGTKAILMAEGVPGSGYVSIDQTSDYCWTAGFAPAFEVRAARKVAGKPCSDPSYDGLYKTVTNNYIAYFLQKRSAGKHLGPSQSQIDIKESTLLCHAMHMVECPGAEVVP